MAIIQSYGALQALTPPTPTWQTTSQRGGLDLYGASAHSYAAIYRTQPNVRTVVEFLARNIAQLGLHVFRRDGDNDRVRLPDHQLARWISKPNPATTRYRLIESLVQDLAIYFNAYWLKLRPPTGELGLVRLPPEFMTVEGGLLPRYFTFTGLDGRSVDFPLTEICHFGGYNPSNPLMGVSPLETLRRILAEEAAAADHREAFWLNSARFEGIIERPATAPRWSPTQRQSWREQWQQAFAGGGLQPGAVAVLEDGMTFKANSFSAKDSEFLAARKLAREECASAYHIPLPMVGILEHATFSNIREQHKNLYQDCLGPWLVAIEEEIERQLLPECSDTTNVYTEFNIAEKLKGSFEEQAASLLALVGRPVMTANEGRARLNLPRSTDPEDDTLAPQQGGPAATVDQQRTEPAVSPAAAVVIRTHLARQQARLAKVKPSEHAMTFAINAEHWQRELAADLASVLRYADIDAQASAINRDTLDLLLAGEDAFSESRRVDPAHV